MKTICCIPVRGNSKRIPKKNLRLLNGIPLVVYAIEAAKNAHVFDEIWLNSEDEIFRQIAEEYGIKFYKRPEEFATDQSTNDDFMYDFLKHVQCDNVIQVLCTSPFITGEIISEFNKTFVTGGYDTLVSVKNIQIECLYDNKALNFSRIRHTQPSQELKPVQAYGCVLMQWNSNTFIKNYESFTGAYHGGNGRTGYFPLSGFATVDIDNEEDFLLAEAISRAIEMNMSDVPPKYYGESITPESLKLYTENPPLGYTPSFKNTLEENDGVVITLSESTYKQVPETYDFPNNFKKGSIEWDVPSILEKDGVKNNNLFESNKLIANIQEVIEANSKTESWSHRFVDSESNSAVLIMQMKNESNRTHVHYEWNEWWQIIQGKWKFTIENEEHEVKQGDIVFIEKGKWHRIESLEDNSIRLAVSRSDVPNLLS